jgi:uncharacterized protein (TIGR02001 family)
MAGPIAAQVAVSATVSSNDVYRGVTLSDGKPVLKLSIAYDSGGGLYAGGAVVGARTAYAGVKRVGHVEYVGYAGRFGAGSTWDVGVVNTNVSNYYYRKYSYDSTEIYAGIRNRNVNFYLYYSPNYYAPGVNTLYAQASGVIRPARTLRLFGHVGALTSLGGGPGVFREQYDVEVGAATHFKRVDVQLAWTTRGPDTVYLAEHPQAHGAVTLSATHVF